MLNLKVITPEKIIFDESVDKVVVPSSDGELGILPNHANLFATLSPGELKITRNSKDTHLAIGDGLLEVSKNEVKILTDLAKEPAEIDEKVLEEARKRAKQALEEQVLSDEEYATTLAFLEKSLAQLKVKRRHHSRAGSAGPETVS